MDTDLSRHHRGDPTFLKNPRTESSQQVYSQESDAKTRAERDASNTPKKTCSSQLTLRLASGVAYELEPVVHALHDNSCSSHSRMHFRLNGIGPAM